jgi:arylsulfatase A-like enzyme
MRPGRHSLAEAPACRCKPEEWIVHARNLPLPLPPFAPFLYHPVVRYRLLVSFWLLAAPAAFAAAPVGDHAPAYALSGVPVGLAARNGFVANLDASLGKKPNNSSIDLHNTPWGQTNTLPNILLIVSDDAGYHDFSMQGNTNFPTPRIDALAAGGARFTSGYVCGAVCSPTRASVMTGRYPQRFGHESNPPAPSTRGLPTNEVTFASLLKNAGYVTGCVGKWHLGELAQFYPTARGFDSFLGFLGPARSYFPIAGPASYEVISSNGVTLAEAGYTTDRFGQAATNFIQRHASEPWFLYLCFNAVHSPLDPDAARINRLTNYTYSSPDRLKQAAVTLALDDNVGLVLDTLDAVNLSSNTLVMFINDNGGDPDWPSDNSPLRDAKTSLYEGGVRVPYLARWPGHIPAGQVLTNPVISLDLLPTALAAAGAPGPTNHPLDGLNLLPLVTGQTNALPRDTLYWRTQGRTAGQSAVRKGDWKMHITDTTGLVQLFQLNPDGTGEFTDLATNNPAKVLELMAAFAQWEAKTLGPLWGQGAVPTINSPYVDSSDLGWLLDGPTSAYSYALVKLRERINWNADFTLKWKLETDSAGTNHNGYLAFGSAANESSLIRAGLKRDAGQPVITEPGSAGESTLTGLTFPSGVLDVEVAFARADNSLTLRVGTNSLKRVLSANYPAITHLGYAVRQARTRFGFFEVDPAIKLAVKQVAAVAGPGGGFRLDAQIERGAPARLVLERTAALGTPFVTVTNSPQLFLGNKLFRFQDTGGGTAAFYRVRAEP